MPPPWGMCPSRTPAGRRSSTWTLPSCGRTRAIFTAWTTSTSWLPTSSSAGSSSPSGCARRRTAGIPSSPATGGGRHSPSWRRRSRTGGTPSPASWSGTRPPRSCGSCGSSWPTPPLGCSAPPRWPSRPSRWRRCSTSSRSRGIPSRGGCGTRWRRPARSPRPSWPG